MSNSWMRRPDGTCFFVLSLLRTKCVSPRFDYISLEESTGEIKCVTYLTSLANCTPDHTKPFDQDDMVGHLNRFLEPKFWNPDRGPNLDESGLSYDQWLQQLSQRMCLPTR